MYLLDNETTANIGFGVIGAERCNLHLQQHGGSCTGGRFSNPPTTPSPIVVRHPKQHPT